MSTAAPSTPGGRAVLPAEDVDGDFGDLRGRPAHAHALGLQRLSLGRRGALGARDDRAGVAHRLARRRREPRDVGHDRLGDVLGDVVGRALLGVAADLARQHDQLGLVVGLEELDDVDERRARDRVAADADDRRVAEPGLGQRVADLVGQRARARDHADVALLEERRRDDAHVGLARRQDARAVGADQSGPRALQVREHAQLVVGRDALGDRDDQRDAGVGGLEDRVGGEARRHEDHRDVRAGLGDRVAERVEHRDALDVLPGLAGGDAGDDVRPVVLVVERVERTLAPGDAGDDQLGVVVDENGHYAETPCLASSTTFWAASSIVAAVCTLGRLASARICRPSTSFVPSSRTTNGTCGSSCLNASMRPLATSSQRVMPPKMLNRTALTFSLERITSTALVIASALDPPPASRKFAGWPPYWATTSSVDMTSPAPLPRMPMSPSSLTNVSPRSLAICSCGSSPEGSRSWALSGWRNSALSSRVTLASSAATVRSGVTISGLTSTSIASSATNVPYSWCRNAPTGRTRSASTPASKARRRPWKSWKPSSGSTCSVAIAPGLESATSSMSMPPCVESMISGALAPRSKTIEA